MIGIVSEADLLLKQQHPADSFQRFLLEGRRRRVQRAKAMGGTAAELMSRPAITVGRDATVAEAARLLRLHLIKRLPVVDPLQRLVGIVSRSDLLSVFLRPDDEIRREILEAVTARFSGPGRRTFSTPPGRPPEGDAPGRHITWR